MERVQAQMTIPAAVDVVSITGINDSLLRCVEEYFPRASLDVHGQRIDITGSAADVQMIMSLLADILRTVQEGGIPTQDSIGTTVSLLHADVYSPAALRDDILLTYRGRAVRPKTTGQKRYVDAIRNHTITFGLGPAGSGKTYLAMAMAVAALKRKEIGRIVLTRPVVEAGEALGFLPGTLEEKLDPYVRPLYDSLFDMTDPEHAKDLIATGVIEIAPLAFMRGRTLNDAFVILDEAQNTTAEQMKMFLTRLGFGSRFVITGDYTQTDLPRGRSSLQSVRKLLEPIDDIAFVDLRSSDIVRHRLVAKIVAAYDAGAHNTPPVADQPTDTSR